MYILLYYRVRKSLLFHKQRSPVMKIRENEVLEEMVECIKKMYDEIPFCIKWRCGEVSEPLQQEMG